MTYAPYIFNDFSGGLNLRAKADQIGADECIDCKDVVFGDGAIRCRPGYDEITSSDTTNAIETLHASQLAGSAYLLAGCGTRLEAIIPGTGGVAASATGKTSTGTSNWYWGFADYGTATTFYTFAGNGENILQSWAGGSGTWGTVANSPKAASLCVTASSNRLVATRFYTTTGGPSGGAGTSSKHHVYFSAAGDPTSWPTTNYVELDPNDGEEIQACIAWRDYVFVFKNTKFYVFTGESTDADGNPVFNYRKVDVGAGMVAPRAVAMHETGVYFVDRNGLYVTTGDTPTKLSGAIDPVFFGLETDYYTDASFYGVWSDCGVVIWQDLVLIKSPDINSSQTVVVYHVQDGWWSRWSLARQVRHWATYYDASRTSDRLYFSSKDSSYNKKIYEISPSYTDDDGTTISAHYTTGFSDFGVAENKRLRQIKLWGTGTSATLTGYSDFDISTTGSTGNIALNPHAGPRVNVGIQRVGFRGTTFAFKVSNLNGGESVHRIEPHIAGSRQPTVTQTEKA